MHDVRSLADRAPLRGVRVLSLAQQLPGPYAGMLLRELGAEVILVEQITGGDPARALPSFFEALNGGKRSIAVDLKSEAGRDVVHRLAATSRIVLEGFRPGVAARLGVDYKSLRAVRPDVIYCSISGYGQEGSDRLTPGHDVAYQARAAGIDLDFYEPGQGGYPVADLSAAMFAALGVVAALHSKESTYIDLSLADSVLAWKGPQLVGHWDAGRTSAAGRGPAYGLFRTRDGWVSLSVMHEDHFWSALCGALGMAEVATLTSVARLARAEELRHQISCHLVAMTTDEALALLVPAGVPAGQVNDSASVAGDRLFRERGMIVDGPGRPVVRTPYSREAPSKFASAPSLGADGVDLMTEVGLPPARIDLLVDHGVLLAEA